MVSRGLRVRGTVALVGALAGLTWLAGCDASNPAKPTPVCSFTLTPQNQAFSSDGGAGAVAIATDASCEWSVEGASEWVALSSPTHGTGPGTVTYTILPNADAAAREKTLTVATRPYKISQEGRRPCAYSIAPEQQAFGDEGGTGQVEVTAAAGCAWSVTSTVAWLVVTDGGSGHGPGLVKYHADPNNSADPRTGTLTIATRTLTVSQEGEGSSQP